MNKNPYQPPTVSIADPALQSALLERPDQVWTAVVLLWLSIAIGLVLAAMQWDYITSLFSSSFVVLVQLVGLGFVAWLYSKIWHGRNWARVTLFVLFVIGLPFSLLQFPDLIQRTPIGALLIGIQLLMKLSALYLIFSAPGSTWFKRVAVMPNNSFESDALKTTRASS